MVPVRGFEPRFDG